MTRETAAHYYPKGDDYAPAQVSRRLEVQLNQQRERIVAIGEVSMVGMNVMSEVERHATHKVTVATKLSATIPSPSAEQELRERLFDAYARRMAQLADMTNVKVLQAVDRAAEQLSRRTLADVLEDLSARLHDAITCRASRLAQPNVRR